MTDTDTDVKIDPDVYLRAIDVIHEMGWGKDDLLCQDGSVCALGAVRVALGHIPVAIEDEEFQTVDVTLLDPEVEKIRPSHSAPAAEHQAYFEAWRTLRAEAYAYERHLDGALRDLTANQYDFTPDFNDHPDTTVQDVIDLLTLAAVKAQEESK